MGGERGRERDVQFGQVRRGERDSVELLGRMFQISDHNTRTGSNNGRLVPHRCACLRLSVQAHFGKNILDVMRYASNIPSLRFTMGLIRNVKSLWNPDVAREKRGFRRQSVTIMLR